MPDEPTKSNPNEPLSPRGTPPEEASQRAFAANPEQKPDHSILFHRYGLQLRVDESDNLILNVLCGRVAQYGVQFTLNLEERNRYKREGDSYLEQLEREVLADPQRFIKRGRTL